MGTHRPILTGVSTIEKIIAAPSAACFEDKEQLQREHENIQLHIWLGKSRIRDQRTEEVARRNQGKESTRDTESTTRVKKPKHKRAPRNATRRTRTPNRIPRPAGWTKNSSRRQLAF